MGTQRTRSCLHFLWLNLYVILYLTESGSANPAGSLCNAEKIFAIWNAGVDGFIPKCDPKGDFEPVQCELLKKECYCAHTVSGEEIPNTRVKKPSIPNCDYPALGATEVDLMKAIMKNKGKRIFYNPDSFNGKPSYEFESNQDIYALAMDYFPPSLWPDFSILATVRPNTSEGGFLFSVVDNLETFRQFGLSISRGDNEYTQNINLWYSENPQENGYVKIAKFLVPLMTGRWSRFAIGVNGTSISLHLYCKSYAVQEYKRSKVNLNFADGSYLLIGHGGDVFEEEPFNGEIQELLITNDPGDAAIQCEDRTDDKKKQEPGVEDEISADRDRGMTGYLPFDDNEPGEGDGIWTGSGVGDPKTESDLSPRPPMTAYNWRPSTTEYFTRPQVATPPTVTDIDMKRVPGPGVDGVMLTLPPMPIGMPGEKGDKGDMGLAGTGEPLSGDLFAERNVIGVKGDRGEPGLQGSPGQHGINGIPGLEGAIGSRGLTGEQGVKGDAGVGEDGAPGIPGESIKGEPGESGEKGEKGGAGRSIEGPQGEPGRSFFIELEELMEEEGSGEGAVEDIFSKVPALELLRGSKGEPGNCTAVDGIPGRDGVDGENGMPGLPGASGVRGESGEQGVQGLQGPNGEEGAKGDSGTAGIKGDKGEHGVRGPTGLPGPPGPRVVESNSEVKEGIPGAPGLSGEDGEPGEQGEKGDTGLKGEVGEKGSHGKDGIEGPHGPRGADGLNGQPGLPGATGRHGMSGINGTKGDKGELGVGFPGPAGPPGPPGPAVGRPFLSGAGGSNNATNGAKGEKGTMGPTGAPGALDLGDLANIILLLKEKGDKGDEGEKGDEGGCVVLKGQRGRRGHRGIKGAFGTTGPKGIIGAPGFAGQNGIPGAPGTPGDSIKGDKGETIECSCEGKVGTKGEKGESGVVTRSGEAAVVQGPPGPPGPPGKSIVGLQGPPGPPGLSGGSVKLSSGSNLGNIIMFTDQEMMTSSSLAIPSGTLGFVIQEQRLYIRVNLGWQAITTGPIIPMSDRGGKLSNSLDFLQESPIFSPRNMKDAAAASGSQQASGLLRLFALNSPVSGADITGVSGADYQCYKQAREAHVSGTFRAVLTSRLQTIGSLVFDRDRDLAIANSKAERVLDSWSGVTNDKGDWVEGVPIYTFDGTNIHTDDRWSAGYFWHGATSTGETDTEAYCQAWTSNSNSELGVSSSFLSGQVLDKSLNTCDRKLAVLCIETTLPEVYRQR